MAYFKLSVNVGISASRKCIVVTHFTIHVHATRQINHLHPSAVRTEIAE